jgi:Metallo-peptidase family M12B Reprolysin-like
VSLGGLQHWAYKKFINQQNYNFKMKKLLFFTILTFSVNTVFSQSCGIASMTYIPNVAPHSESGVWINIYYHVVKKADGSGSTITNADICNTTRVVNNIFNKYGIFIKQLGFDEIKNNALYDFGSTSAESALLFSTQLRQNAVNVYIVPSIAHPCAKNIPSYALAVGESDIKNRPSILAHEMGHCFGLYHTHEIAFGVEQINGSNSTSAGDKISDTAADPDLSYSVSNCQYTGSALYTPDPRNVMSYSNPSCLDRFSPFQVNAIYNTIFGRNVGSGGPDYFVDIRAATNGVPIPSISGANPICFTGQQLSVNNVQSPFITFWDSSNPAVATASNFFQIDKTQITKNSDGFTTIMARVTDFCQLYTVTKEIYVGKPPVIEGTYTYGSNTYPLSNPSTGIGVSSSTPNIYINLTQSIPNLTYSWNVVSSGNTSGGSVNSYLSANGNQASIYLAGSNYMNVNCTTTNNCGASPTLTLNCYNYSYYQVMASPNPASQNLSITTNLVNEGSVSNRSEPLLKTKDINKTLVKLVDGNNRVIASGKLSNGTFSCQLANVPNGTYYLQISEGTDMITKQILVQH